MTEIWSVFGAPQRKLKGEEVENLDSESRDRPIRHIKKLELHNLLHGKCLYSPDYLPRAENHARTPLVLTITPVLASN